MGGGGNAYRNYKVVATLLQAGNYVFYKVVTTLLQPRNNREIVGGIVVGIVAVATLLQGCNNLSNLVEKYRIQGTRTHQCQYQRLCPCALPQGWLVVLMRRLQYM